MYEVINKGYEYTVGKRYLHALEKEFNIKFDNKKLLNTSNILEMMYNKLSNNYKGKIENYLYNKMKFTSKIHFINFNKKAWFEIISKYFENNPNIQRKILFLNKNISNSNILEILGNKYKYNLVKIKNYLENV